MIINLDSSERLLLENAAQHSNDPRSLRRAQALIWLADGASVEEVADRLRVTPRTIYHWVTRFCSRSAQDLCRRLADAPRQGRPASADGIIDDLIDEAIETDPRLLGYNSTFWTAELLRHYLRQGYGIEVSLRSVSYAIERLHLRWKRPRHDLARTPRTWRQAKGG